MLMIGLVEECVYMYGQYVERGVVCPFFQFEVSAFCGSNVRGFEYLS